MKTGRFILIDNASGYVWGDSADLDGRIFTGSALEFARALDESLGEYGRSYEEVGRYELGANELGYQVYRADIDGSEAVPVVWDGQDQATIDEVTRLCRRVGTIRITRDAS